MEDINEHISKVRSEYSHATLDESMVDKDPIRQFEKWFREAMDASVIDPICMTLATCGKDNRPSARVVLLRDFTSRGFSFFTNYNSHKSSDMLENPYACLNFFWHEVQRQVRIVGKVEKVDDKDSTDYFDSRPEGSKVGAWASPQSQIIPNRDWLVEQIRINTERFHGRKVERPSWWGGFRVIPEEIEFWQGRESRLHDRIVYRKEGGVWQIVRKAP